MYTKKKIISFDIDICVLFYISPNIFKQFILWYTTYHFLYVISFDIDFFVFILIF